LVEPVHLIDKENRSLLRGLEALAGIGNGLPNVGDPSEHGVDGDKMAARGIGHDHGQRRLPRPRWAVENQRGELVSLDGPTQQAPWAEDMLLTDKLVQCARSHARCQRLCRSSWRHDWVF